MILELLLQIKNEMIEDQNSNSCHWSVDREIKILKQTTASWGIKCFLVETENLVCQVLITILDVKSISN